MSPAKVSVSAGETGKRGEPLLKVGFLPMPDFTMLALAGFIDTLRLAADDGDRSRPLRCSWEVMTHDRLPVAASNGVQITPTSGLRDATKFDYLVVVGGTLHKGHSEPPETVAYLRNAAALGVPLIGVCTGSLVLARAGLMKGRTTCVSWFHYDDFVAEFPDQTVRADRLFIKDGPRITCAGGVSVVHLASHLVELHCGPGEADKGLRIMIEASQYGPDAPQPEPRFAEMSARADVRVRRAILMMERNLQGHFHVSDIAAQVGASPRQLNRLFLKYTEFSPAAYQLELRLHRARERVLRTTRSMADIAYDCGFSDASHMARCYRRRFGVPPIQDRHADRDEERRAEHNGRAAEPLRLDQNLAPTPH